MGTVWVMFVLLNLFPMSKRAVTKEFLLLSLCIFRKMNVATPHLDPPPSLTFHSPPYAFSSISPLECFHRHPVAKEKNQIKLLCFFSQFFTVGLPHPYILCFLIQPIYFISRSSHHLFSSLFPSSQTGDDRKKAISINSHR